MTVFFECKSGEIIVYLSDGGTPHPAIIARKFSELMRLGQSAAEGLLRTTDQAGDAVEIVDHPLLLRLASACYQMAAEKYT